ncbi:hypothetical protein CYK57_00838 [Actinobacillus pleuropneumoniae]|nr:hypothetical protein CYK57_00838 [Actinobacillus pleuropneumoniae]
MNICKRLSLKERRFVFSKNRKSNRLLLISLNIDDALA